ncbi:MAG: YhdP family protein [Pseudomonadota bacterium]
MDQTTLSQTLLPSRGIRWAAAVARLLLWLVVAFWVLLGLSWGLLHGWIVPRIEDFRPRLEAVASRALGIPVTIGAISARSTGLIPSFELKDVSLLDHQGRAALRLPSVVAAVSPQSLWGLGFEQLYLDSPELDVRRAADGRIFVAGLEVARNIPADEGQLLEWLFSQEELAFRGGTVRWTDELRAAPPLVLTNVDWVLRNPGKRHMMRLDATPPAEWGERFSLRGIFRQPLLHTRHGNWRAWTGQLYAEFSRMDVAQLRQYVRLDDLGLDLTAGSGALRAWADVSLAEVAGATADVSLQGVNLRLGQELQPIALQSLQGRFGGRRLATGSQFSTEDLQFQTAEGLAWPGGNVAITRTDAEAGKPERTELKADRLDLAALALIADRLPIDAATRAVVASFAPRGLVEKIDAQWQGPLSATMSFAAKGRVSGLELAGLASPLDTGIKGSVHPGRPGISGAAVEFNLTHQGGQANVLVTSGSMDFPGVFDEPRVPFDRLAGEVIWKRDGNALALQLRNLQFANADAEGQASASWHTATATRSATGTPVADAGFPGVLDLQGSLSRGLGARVYRYLPRELPVETRRYVQAAVLDGTLGDVKFRVKGDLRDLPFADPKQGEFFISTQVRQASYAYVPRAVQLGGPGAVGNAAANAANKTWPALVNLEGELVFRGSSLEVNKARGGVAGLPGIEITAASARVPSFGKGASVQVNAELKGPLGEAVGFVNSSPVSAMLGDALAATVASGSADYALKLDLPLAALDKSRVQGSVSLPGNDVQFLPEAPVLGRLKGVVSFTESGFRVNGAQARMLGGEVRFDGGMQPASGRPGENEIAFRGQGTLTSEGLAQARELGAGAGLAAHAKGSAAYTLVLVFKRGQPEFSFASNLQGMALSLPPPLAKNAETLLPVRLDKTLLRESLAGARYEQDSLSMTLGRLATLQYVRDISGDQPRVLRGAIAVGTDAEVPPLRGGDVAANISVGTLDVDAWRRLLDEPVAGSPRAAPAAASANAAGNAVIAEYLPDVFALRAAELKVSGRQLNKVVVGGSREGSTWRANMDSGELNGYAEYRPATGVAGAAAGRLYARLSRLSLGASTASDVEALLDEQPAAIPALDIVVEDFDLRGKKMGRVEIDAVNGARAQGQGTAVREWRLNKFNVILPEAVFTASGSWSGSNALGSSGASRPRAGGAERRRTLMNFKLDVADSGELLKRFGMEGVIRRGRGKLEGQAGWTGSPLGLDTASLNGQINMNMESGQFLKADPGIAKLLGVLSLQSLPRRLALDFRDVFSEGFAFDFVRGDMTITNGLATTNNLQMKGVNAAVLMEGSADVGRETQDLKVVIVPEINAGTASLIATAINPAIGLGTFLAQVFLRRPLTEAATQEFHIDGTWSDPRITRVNRKAAALAAESKGPP